MGTTTNTSDGLPVLSRHDDQDTGGLPILKKKEPAGGGPTPSPSASSPKPAQTAPLVDTSASGSKAVTANYKNNSITARDIDYKPGDMAVGISPEQISHGINNKGKNIEQWANIPSENYIKSLVSQRNGIQKQLSDLDSRVGSGSVADADQATRQKRRDDLSDFDQYLKTQIQKEYDTTKEKLVPELSTHIQQSIQEGDFNSETHLLTPKAVAKVAAQVDGIMNKKKNAVVNAAVSGDLDDKQRTYEDLTKSVVDNLNLIPIQKAQHAYAQEYAKQHPDIEAALKANEEINDYFSHANFDDVKAKIKVQADKEFMTAGQRYYGDGGLFQKNQDYIGIQHKYAQLVGEGKMTEDVAKKQMKAEIAENPNLKKIKSNYDAEIRKIIESTQKQYQEYVIAGLKKDHPKYTVYSDGTPGLASIPEEDYKKMLAEYKNGEDAIAEKMGAETNVAWKKMADQKATSTGAFWGSLGASGNALMSSVTKMVFNKTGWGGQKVRNFEAQEIASPQVSQSDVAATWNWKGYESLLNPNFYLSNVGGMVPVIAGGAAVSAITEGGGLPEYVGWLASAGLFTAQTSLSTYGQLLNTKDENGNMLSEADASHFAAQQAEKDFLPNVLMMAVTSGTLLKAKNIVKPSVLGTVGKAIKGTAAAQPFFSWQGYNDYATMLEAQGKKPDVYDYLQSKDFRDNLVNGLIVGGGLSLLHAPGTHMKAMDNWEKMVHSSEGEFKNLIPQNYALGQEMSGNGNYLRDALKMHVFNVDPEGLNEEGKRQLADLKNTLLYSVNLDKNIRTGNLDRNNINDLYQAHNLALADQHDHLADQAAKEGNKSLSDIYKDKAKDYREQAKGAADGSAKYHYLIDENLHPIFMSDRSFETLEQEGVIRQWIKDKTVKGVVDSDNPEFEQKYKDFITAKDESSVEGKNVMDHASDLIEENKDKLGTYYAVAKENPEVFYKEVSDQIHGTNADGSISLRPDAEIAAREQFGDDIVDLAKVLHPITEKEGGQNEELHRPEESTGQQQQASTRSEDQIGRVPEGQSDGGKNSAEAAKEVSSEDNITVSEMLDKKGTYKGQRGTFTQDGQAVIFKVDNSGREYELGNVNEVGGRSVKDFGIEQENTVVGANEAGNVMVRGKEYVNNYSDPLQAINYDKDGNLVSVTLDTPDGQKRTFRGPVAEDIAYQITLKQISDNNEQPALEQFINDDKDAREEIDNGRPSEASEEEPVGDNASVQREKIEPKNISSPKSERDEKTKEAERRQGNVLTPKEGGKESLKSGKTPPSVPPSEPSVKEANESPKEEFTSVRKAKQSEIKGAKTLFEKQKIVKWTETYDKALSKVQADYPKMNLYDAMRSRINEFVTKLQKGELFNPTSEDIAVFNVFKNETTRRMTEISGWDSPDTIQRMAAVAEYTVLHNDLFNVVRVNNPEGEAGRAFNMLQSEVAQDPDYGLQIRRMELLGAKGGDRLSEEDLDLTSKTWEKEKALLQKERELREKGMEDEFNKKLADVRADYEKQLKAAKEDKKPGTQKEKREQLLKQKGADLAAKIRSGKLKGTYATFPGLPQAINVVLEGVARLVEGGYTLAQAIDEYVAANKIKDKDQFQKNLFDVFTKQEKQEDALDKIREMTVASGATDITTDMVGKNLIKQYIDSHVGLHDTKDVLDIAHNELKTILPDLEKDQLRDAYLKQGDFKQPKKKELENGFKVAQKNFDRLTSLEKDINELNEKKNLFNRKSNKPFPYEKEIEAKEREKKQIMDSLDIKTSGEDKYKKASYDQRAKAHNDRLESVGKSIDEKLAAGGLSDKSEKALIKLKNLLDAATIKIDPTSAASQEKTLDGGLSLLKGIKSEFQRSAVDDVSKIGDINRALQKVIDKFDSDKGDSEQNIKLQRAKDKAKRDAKDLFDKITKGEFDDTPAVPLTKTDAELIKLERERGALNQIYRNRRDQYEKANKTPWRRVAEFVRAAMVDWMIGAPFTIAKVGASAILRPSLETATKLTFGKLFEAAPFETTKAITAKAREGGESADLKGIKKGWSAYLGQYSEKQLSEKYQKANDKFELSDKAYIDQQAEVDRLKYMGKDKPEYKEAEKALQDLKNKRDSALVDAIGNSMYQFIGGGSMKEALEVLLHRSTAMERQFGEFDREGWEKASGGTKEKFLTGLDNLQYIMNFVGRSHAALKNFSARFSFGTGFMARLESAVQNGVDISRPDKILEIGHAAYHDWERGKYQESNWLTDTWNKVTTKVESISPEMAYLMRADVAITRVPVNMLREGIMEYTFGAFKGSWDAFQEWKKAKKMTLYDGFTKENQEQFKKELKENLDKIDPDKAAAILRSFRKGGLGLGLYSLAALGHVAFGGWAHKGQTAEDKKKMQRELDTGIPEIKTGEIKIGNWVLPEFASKIAEHTPAFYSLGFGLGLAQVYKNNIVDGRTTTTAALNSLMAQINHVTGSLPMIDKLILPLASGAAGNILPKGQWDDVDQEGNPMKRKAFNVTDYFKYLHVPFTQGFKKDILSENYYKQAISTQKSYRDQITEVETNTSLSPKEKEEQRKDLLKELDDAINDIYVQNKENPQ